jgi:hypothetical protein
MSAADPLQTLLRSFFGRQPARNATHATVNVILAGAVRISVELR